MDVDYLKPYDMVVRGSDDTFFTLGSGVIVPQIANRDRRLIVAALKYWAEQLEDVSV